MRVERNGKIRFKGKLYKKGTYLRWHLRGWPYGLGRGWGKPFCGGGGFILCRQDD